DLDLDALPPALELLDRRSAERVGRRQDHTLARALERGRQLRRRRGLAGAVHAEQQNDRGQMIEVERLRPGGQRVDEEAAEERAQLGGAGHRPEHDLLARAIGEIGGQRRSQVRCDQQLLELLEQRVVDGSIRLQHGAQTAREVLLRPLESLTKTLTETGEELHGVSAGRTSCRMTTPLAPSGGMGRPLSSRVTPTALPTEMMKGRLDTHSRTCPGGIVSSLVLPSSVRTLIQVSSVVRATSRYDETSPARAAGEGAGTDAATPGEVALGGGAAGCWTLGDGCAGGGVTGAWATTLSAGGAGAGAGAGSAG